MDIAWTYLGGEDMDILDEGDHAEAVRREWWYDSGNTYVYQLRQEDGSWGDVGVVYGEFESEPLPPEIQETLRAAGFTLCYTTEDLIIGSRWRHKKRGSEYEITSIRVLQCAQKIDRPRDGDSLVCYDSTDPDCPPEFRVWARPVDEFLDGRFEKLDGDGWNQVDLPFSENGQEFVYPEAPNLDAELLAEFGTTWETVDALHEGPLWKLFTEQMDALVAQDDQEGEDPYDALPQAWLDSGDPEKKAYAENLLLRRRMRTWEVNHPSVLTNQKATQAARLAGTFEGLGLVRPGVQIEMADGKQHLIGSINPLRGVCDDCTAFDPTDIVARYRILVPEEKL